MYCRIINLFGNGKYKYLFTLWKPFGNRYALRAACAHKEALMRCATSARAPRLVQLRATHTRLVARLLVGRHRQGPRASLEEVRDATGLPSAVYVSCSSTYTRSVVVGIGGSTDNNIWSTGSERVKKYELLRCAISYFAETVPWLNFTV